MEEKISQLEKENAKLKEKLDAYKKPLNAFYVVSPAKNKIDKVNKFLAVYSEVTNNKLLPIDKKVLAYYIVKGLTDETLEMVLEDDPTFNPDSVKEKKPFTRNHLHGINKRLKDKGFLQGSLTNERKFFLSEEMTLLQKKINVDQCKGIIISL